MHVPILILRQAVVSDAEHVAIRFPQHADEAGEVELLVLAAEANARDLHRQIVLVHRGSMLLAGDGVCDAVAVFAFSISASSCISRSDMNTSLQKDFSSAASLPRTLPS